MLELFHGPTFAFKDVALQFLGNLFEYFLVRGRIQNRITILGATSGDTGSAAIHGLRGKKNVNCFILYPKGKVTEIQESMGQKFYKVEGRDKALMRSELLLVDG